MFRLLSISIMIIGVTILGFYIVPEIGERVTPVTNITLSIEKIGINTDVNNESIDQGVYQKPGTMMLFGHRTTHGSIFYNLDKIVVDDIIVFNGENYSVIKTSIVSEDTSLIDNGNLFLVTCTPLGSTSHRIVVEAKHV